MTTVDTTRITTTTIRAIKLPIINISKPIQATTNTKPILGIIMVITINALTMLIIRKATIIMAELLIKFYCHIEIFEYSRSGNVHIKQYALIK